VTIKLYGCNGCGSAAVEAVLQLADVPYEFIDAIEWQPEFKRHTDVERLNPLGQVPVLVLDDGTIMTESVAMALYFAERVPGLVPTAPSTRAACLRWLIFMSANIYAVYAFRDFPARWVEGEATQKAFRERTNDRLREYWQILERELSPAPFALGHNMTVVDIFIAMMSRWGPGRQWIIENCPKLMASVKATENHPVVARVWEKNFGK
jgi:GST-like protein